MEKRNITKTESSRMFSKLLEHSRSFENRAICRLMAQHCQYALPCIRKESIAGTKAINAGVFHNLHQSVLYLGCDRMLKSYR